MWEETITFEKSKFNTEEVFSLFTQFDDLQANIPWKDNLSYKEYSDFIGRLTAVYYKKHIATAKMNNTFATFPIKKSDLVKIINSCKNNQYYRSTGKFRKFRKRDHYWKYEKTWAIGFALQSNVTISISLYWSCEWCSRLLWTNERFYSYSVCISAEELYWFSRRTA